MSSMWASSVFAVALSALMYLDGHPDPSLERERNRLEDEWWDRNEDCPDCYLPSLLSEEWASEFAEDVAMRGCAGVYASVDEYGDNCYFPD